jgi:hypothetical protein
MDMLFLTNFSDYCFRCIPAIAQMADVLKVRLTILHAYDPAKIRHSSAQEQVNSFFPEADRYVACHRLAVPGPLTQVVKEHLEGWPVDLIVAPASDAVGFPRIGVRSNRSSLIQASGIPIWTLGRRAVLRRLHQPVQNVACWLDFRSQTDHLVFALEYASKLRAKLHLMSSLPTIDEGMLALGLEEKPLSPDLAAAQILKLCANASIRPEVHVSRGNSRVERARMLRECDADVVFLRTKRSALAEWFGLGLRACDSLPCPAICIGDNLKIPVWNLASGHGISDLVLTPFRRVQPAAD